MRGTKNADLGGGQDLWPTLKADVDRPRSDQPSLQDLVEKIIDDKLAESKAERRELKKEARWMSVRVLTLEQSLKKSREENEALSQYLQLCFDEIRAQDDRLSPRLATIEGEIIALSSRASKVDTDNTELRKETREALSEIDALKSELLELIFDAKSVAVEARGNADAAASQADELVLGISETRKQFTSLEGRTNAISSNLEDTVEAAEMLAAGLSQAAEATVLAHAAAEEARLQAEGIAGLSDELRKDLEQRTDGFRKELAHKASLKTVKSLEVADRERIELLRTDLEQRTKTLVDELAVKASSKDLEVLETADRERIDGLRADLEQRTQALVDEISAKASVDDLEQRTQALREEISSKASTEDLKVLEEADRFLVAADDVLSDELRVYLEQNTAALRKEIERKAPREDLQSLEEADRSRAKELRSDLVQRTEALSAEIAAMATAEDVQALEEADRVLEEELKATSELSEEVRVLAEKAKSRAEYASDATDELRADFDELPENAAHDGTAEQAEALEDLRAEVTSSLEALRSRVDERLNGHLAQAAGSTDAVIEDLMATPEVRRKRWHAHLRGESGPHIEEASSNAPKELPSET